MSGAMHAIEIWDEGEPAEEPCQLRPLQGGEDHCNTEPAAPEQSETRWNVLAEELVSFPPAVLERPLPIQAQQPSARDRRQAEAWLERELVQLRSVADRAYPEAPSLGRARRPVRLEAAPAALDPTRLRPAPATRTVRTVRPARPARVVASPRRARVVAPAGRVATHVELRGLRRLLPGVATLAVLGAIGLGVGALSSLHRPQAVVIPGATRTAHGLVYVARPGDTLWSIAQRTVPNGDPRPLVAELEQQLGGAPLQPGDHLHLP